MAATPTLNLLSLLFDHTLFHRSMPRSFTEIARVRDDADFMESLRALTERDREILDRLAG